MVEASAAVTEGACCCSRAFIRAVMAAPDYPVTSPTFTLQNIYDEHEGVFESSHLGTAAPVLQRAMHPHHTEDPC